MATDCVDFFVKMEPNASRVEISKNQLKLGRLQVVLEATAVHMQGVAKVSVEAVVQ